MSDTPNPPSWRPSDAPRTHTCGMGVCWLADDCPTERAIRDEALQLLGETWDLARGSIARKPGDVDDFKANAMRTVPWAVFAVERALRKGGRR